jgi:hypothetical protein
MERAIIASTGVEFGDERRRLGISARAAAAHLGIRVVELLGRERDTQQLTLTQLQAWGEALRNAAMASKQGEGR